MEKNEVSNLESKRLKELKSYFILDTPPEFQLDEITKIASYICKTPIALISLVDEDRLWFKSKVGVQADQISRSLSFCSYAISNDGVFIVENAIEDDRFTNNKLMIHDLKIRFYAGMPLKSSNGYNIGTLCVLDRKKNKLDKNQIEVLKSLAQQVINYFELYKKNIELSALRNTIIQNEKMSSIVSLSAGISHEINNPLAIIVGRVHLIENQINSESAFAKKKILQDLKSISDASKRISNITNGLSQFSMCSNDEAFKTVPLPDIMSNTLILCESKILSKGIDLIIDEIPNINLHCKPTNFSHAIYNIIINSYDSILDLQEKWIQIKFENILLNNELKISIIDSGKGVSSEIRDKIMEPFFSTREIGSAKGLGLSISKGIIEELGGKLIYDDSNKNTCFIIKVIIT